MRSRTWREGDDPHHPPPLKARPDRGRGSGARRAAFAGRSREVGQPYDVRLVSFAEMKQPAHLALQSLRADFPTYEEGELALFETGAIVFHNR